MRLPLHAYGFFRIALVSPELRVADVAFNLERIAQSLHSAAAREAHLVLLPDL
ncbi:MAG: hypothetical protein RMJ46_06360 [Bacteroidota bacterium]|nr:hypothetical protein [Bacteroidota bacterium]